MATGFSLQALDVVSLSLQFLHRPWNAHPAGLPSQLRQVWWSLMSFPFRCPGACSSPPPGGVSSEGQGPWGERHGHRRPPRRLVTTARGEKSPQMLPPEQWFDPGLVKPECLPDHLPRPLLEPVRPLLPVVLNLELPPRFAAWEQTVAQGSARGHWGCLNLGRTWPSFGSVH